MKNVWTDLREKSYSKPSKKRRKTNWTLFYQVIRQLYFKESPFTFQLLKSDLESDQKRSQKELFWTFGMKQGEIPNEFFTPYLKQFKQKSNRHNISPERSFSKVTKQECYYILWVIFFRLLFLAASDLTVPPRTNRMVSITVLAGAFMPLF